MRMLIGVAAVTVLALTATSRARAEPIAPPPLAAYAADSSIDQVALSPSGERYAMIAFDGKERRLFVTTTKGQLLTTARVGEAKVRDVFWVGDDHLFVTVSATVDLARTFDLLGSYKDEVFSALHVDLTKNHISAVFGEGDDMLRAEFGYAGGRQVDGRWYAWFRGYKMAHSVTSTYLDHYYSDLYRVDLATGKATMAAHGEENRDRAWTLGPDGAVAVHSEYDRAQGRWRLFAGDDRQRLYMDRQAPLREISVRGLGRTPGTVLVRDGSGETPRYDELTLSDGATKRLFEDEDPGELLHDSGTGLLIGAGYPGVDGGRLTLFDPQAQARWRGTVKAFPGHKVQLQSHSADFGRMIVTTDGPDDAGTWWLVDIATGKADELGSSHPRVPAAAVGATRRFEYKAADGLELDGVLTLPPGRADRNLPLIVMPHGGPIGVFDDVGFDWWVQAFASRGYAVFQPNFRGSGGHGAALRKAGFGEWGRKMQTDVSDGLAALVAKGVADPRRVCIMGGSYGGYAALAGVTVQQGLYRCAVSYGGVSDLKAMLADEAERNGHASDDVRFWREAMGVRSSSDASLKAISPADLADRADAPVLLIHGEDDTVVSIDQSRRMERALKAAGKPVEFVTLKGEDHWLSREATRKAMLEAAVAFVEAKNPSDPPAAR